MGEAEWNPATCRTEEVGVWPSSVPGEGGVGDPTQFARRDGVSERSPGPQVPQWIGTGTQKYPLPRCRWMCLPLPRYRFKCPLRHPRRSKFLPWFRPWSQIGLGFGTPRGPKATATTYLTTNCIGFVESGVTIGRIRRRRRRRTCRWARNAPAMRRTPRMPRGSRVAFGDNVVALVISTWPLLRIWEYWRDTRNGGFSG